MDANNPRGGCAETLDAPMSATVSSTVSTPVSGASLWFLVPAWCAFTALSQVLSGLALSRANGGGDARGVMSPFSLLAVQALAGAAIHFIAERILSLSKRTTRASASATASDSVEESGLVFFRNTFLVAFITTVGLLTAHVATAQLQPAQSQVLKSGEIFFSLFFSYSFGISLGPGKVALLLAATLAFAGACLTIWDHALFMRVEPSFGGTVWAMLSCACLAGRSVIFKLLQIKGGNSDSAVAMTALLFSSFVVGTFGEVAFGAASQEGFLGSLSAIVHSPPSAYFSGIFWYAYQRVSIEVLRLMPPPAHAVLNNAKRSIVLVVALAFFPKSVSLSLRYCLGVLLMLLAAALSSAAPRFSELLLARTFASAESAAFIGGGARGAHLVNDRFLSSTTHGGAIAGSTLRGAASRAAGLGAPIRVYAV